MPSKTKRKKRYQGVRTNFTVSHKAMAAAGLIENLRKTRVPVVMVGMSRHTATLTVVCSKRVKRWRIPKVYKGLWVAVANTRGGDNAQR
jgi:hypothetical protein